MGVRSQSQLFRIPGPHETGKVLAKSLVHLCKDVPGRLKSLRQRLAHSDCLAPLPRKDQREFFHVWFLQIAPVVKGDRECKQALEKQTQMRFTPAFTRRHAALGSLE